MAGALAFRWDRRRARFLFQTQPGSYTDRTLIVFLRDLKRHFRRRPVILIWDGLPAHKSARMSQYLAHQRTWLQVERLPGYAPALNPVEPSGATSNAGNWPMCVRRPSTRFGCRSLCIRVRRRPGLALSFLHHAGLDFKHDRCRFCEIISLSRLDMAPTSQHHLPRHEKGLI